MAETKGKKVTKSKANVIAPNRAEEKEVGFEELSLIIKQPQISENGTVAVVSNFEELSAKVKKVVEEYSSVTLTDDNYNYVKSLKQNFVSLRTGIEKTRKDYMKIYLDPAKSALNAMCADLTALVENGENALQAQLDIVDQRRLDELKVVLAEYKEDAVAKHGLRPEFAEQLILKDKYFNKTQKEEDSADDIELQAVELEKKQKEYDAGLELIKTECQACGFLPDAYIRSLKYKSAMEVVLDIKADKKASDELAEMQTKEVDDTPVTVGEPIREEVKDFMTAEEKRERTLWIRYTPSQAKALKECFIKLGIEYKFI